MKLLFDENLSHKLAEMLGSDFPGCVHVRDVGLLGAKDSRIWEFAGKQSFVIVSKDTDFRERSFVEGFPPKIIWLDVGNAGSMVVAGVLARERQRIERFVVQDEASLLSLSIGRIAI